MKIPFLERLDAGPLLFDGGNGTTLYGRDVFINLSYEELNLSKPELVEEVHRAFVMAGAEAVETNSFAANRPRLESYGLGERVREINREAARLASHAVGSSAYVAGAVGPLGIRLEPWGPTTVDEAVALFREQIEGLVEGGAELIILETFSDLVEIQAAVSAARALGDLPVIAMMTVDEAGRTPEGVPPEWLGQKLEQTGADVIGVNCSVGPASMISVIEIMANVCTRPLAAMPNAGIPRPIDGRLHYLTSPAFMARYVRRFVDAGARIVGGCCGVTPDHIQAMSEALGRSQGAPRALPKVQVSTVPDATPHDALPLEDRSRLGRKVRSRRFLTMVEVAPPRVDELEDLLERIEMLAQGGVDAALVSDDPRAMGRLSSLATACLVLERGGGRSPAWNAIEPVLQLACRDRTLLGMQADLLGAHALGLYNVMPVTGNAPRPGEAVWSSAVFDVDAIGLTNVIWRLNHGLDVGDTPIGKPTRFFAAANATICAPDHEAELRRFAWKVDAGAELAISTPVFERVQLEAFLERIEAVRVPFVARLHVVGSLREAEHLAAEVPDVSVPEELLERFAAARDPIELQALAVEHARGLVEEIAPLVEGIALSGRPALSSQALEILENVLDAPVPQEREFPGRPGVMGGAEAARYRREQTAEGDASLSS